jgi:uncharacterized membrane protein YkvA (DUF1232 family)
VKVSFELSPKDIRYFRERLKQARSGATDDEDLIIEQTQELVAEAAQAEPPEFVTVRLARLEQLIEMLRDDEWQLQGRDRVRILDALTYFVDPDDMIPDKLPGIGYIDDAIMIELVVQDLEHDIAAYEDFCSFRADGTKNASPEKMEVRRESLQSRMRRRRRKRRDVARSSPRRGGKFRLL